VTAPVIIFCRYDFFPELLLLKLRGKKLILLSGAVKKNSWYKKNAFKMFSVIVAASQNEEILFSKINPEAQLFTFDFRIQRITERWTLAKKVLNEIPLLKNYLSYLNEIPVNNRIILGSAWESDLQIFNDPGFIDDIKNSQVHVAIVPHKLNEENIKNIITHLEKFGLANHVSVLNENSRPNSIVIVNRSGILCELYSNFRHSYIGGGFERSIHSVFEPFFSGSMVYCGPKFHRSTEYDLIKEIAPHEIQVLFQAEKFYTVYMQYKNLNLNLEVRDQWRQVASVKISQIASAIDVK
jgi:3-deoxy-D-manno-octulosonic-acid transferase